MITPETPIGEVLPAETIRRLGAFLARKATGQVTLDAKEGVILHGAATEHWKETLHLPPECAT